MPVSKQANRNAEKRAAKKSAVEEPVESVGSSGGGLNDIAHKAKSLVLDSCLVTLAPDLQPLLKTPTDVVANDNGPEKISVAIGKATNLKHLNMTGDNCYCLCERVAHGGEATKCFQTEPVKSLSPEWNHEATVELSKGDSLKFSVFDDGLITAKSEGSVLLDAAKIGSGFDGDLKLDGLDDGHLHPKVVAPTSKGKAEQMFNTLCTRICWCNFLGLGLPATAEDAMKGWNAIKEQDLDWGPRPNRKGSPSMDRILININDNLVQYLYALFAMMLIRTFLFRSFFTCLPWVFALLMASVYVPLDKLPQVEVKFRVVGTMACLVFVWLFFLYELIYKTYFFEKIPLLGFIAFHAHSVRPRR